MPVKAFTCLSLMRSADDRKLEEPALDRAVEKRCAPRDLEVDELCEPQIAGEEIRRPAREALLERVTERRVELRELLLIGEAHAVRRVGEQRSARRGCVARQDIR